ncbi:MAG: uroporphyrinogen-III synthase [Janthinobacterium lividum]
MPHASFDGLHVLSFEARRAREVEKLIRTYNGDPLVVPAMRELPLPSNTACLEFGRHLLAGDFDVVLFLTGVGVRTVMDILATESPRESILAALRTTQVVARGSKPASALRELGVPVAAISPEPSTWREVVSTLETTFGERLGEMRLAVQEYGATNPEMLSELVQRCAAVTKVPAYLWGLPLDLGPLRESVLALVHGTIDVVLFMTAVQVIHLFQVAEEMGLADELRRGLEAIVVVSVGPTTTEELQHYRVQPDFQPSRPKMGFLINEAAQYAGKLLAIKRTPLPPVELLSGSIEATETQVEARAISYVSSAGTTRGVVQVAPSTSTMAGFLDGLAPLDILHEISSRIATADPLHVVLGRIVKFVSTVFPCDSCFLYTVEGDELVLRASKNPHADMVDRLKISLGEGVTGWVAEHREVVAIAEHASDDPRFRPFLGLPEDRFEAMLCVPIVCANRVVGVLNLQHREPYAHNDIERRLLSTIGTLVGAEMERARLETENSELIHRLEMRKLVDKAKGILQRDLNLSEDEAYRSMQLESRKRRRSMREIAEAILLAEDLRQTELGKRLQPQS